MTTKVKRVSSIRDQNQEIMLVECNDELRYFTMDEIEEHLNNYFSLIEKMQIEKDLRETHEIVKEAYDEYRTTLYLVSHTNDLLEE